MALADEGLDRLAARGPGGERLSLRRMLSTNEEYARHTGPCGSLRESIDGLVGDYPPAEVPWVSSLPASSPVAHLL